MKKKKVKQKKKQHHHLDKWDDIAGDIIELELILHELSDALSKSEIREIKATIASLEQDKEKLIKPTTYANNLLNMYGQTYFSDVEEDLE